jgi:hypothetical protein
MPRRGALALVVACAALAACGYDAPDYSDARFRCDQSHPCPSGQTCISGLCEGVGGDGDAATTDAAGPDGMYSGINCGSSICTLDQQCCADVVGGTRCAAPGAFCAGISTRCDGPEDCPGQECCLSAGSGTCTPIGTCSTSLACHVAADCGAGGDECCPILETSWNGCFQSCPGTVSTLSTLTPTLSPWLLPWGRARLQSARQAVSCSS